MTAPAIAAALRRGARLATARPAASAWTVAALACALLLGAAALGAAGAIERWAAARPGAAAALVVYLSEGVPAARGAELAAELRALPGVARATLVPPAESGQRLLEALGPEPALLEGVDPAALPASIEVELAPGVRDVVAMSPTLRALGRAPGVALVAPTSEVADPARGGLEPSGAAAAAELARGAGPLAALLALALAAAVVRVRLDRDRQELAVARLLGAGPGFSVLPAAVAGALLGLAAGLLAAAGAAAALAARGSTWAAALGGPVGCSPAELAAALGGAALAGLVGGALAGASRG